MSASIILITVFALCISLLYITSLITRKGGDTKKRLARGTKTAPDAGGSWPLLGHLHLLGGPLPAHLVLAQMADKYGPIFTISLGLRGAVVVNTWELAKECLTTNDRAFATRPRTMAYEILTYKYAMVCFSPYSPYWRQVRRISTLELLSSHRISLLRQVREYEVLTSVRDIYQEYRKKNSISTSDSRAEPASSLLVDMKRWFGDITVNIMFKMIVGKRFNDDGEGDEGGRKALRDWIELMGRFVVSDGLPFLRCLDLGGHEKAMKRTAQKLDRVVQRWLDEHKARRNSDGAAVGAVKSEQDFMDVLLSILGDAEISSYDSDTINKATCMQMILAGTDTTTVTMTWAISLLLNNKEALKKIQHDLDAQIGKDRQAPGDEAIDMEEAIGLTNLKASPLEVLFGLDQFGWAGFRGVRRNIVADIFAVKFPWAYTDLGHDNFLDKASERIIEDGFTEGRISSIFCRLGLRRAVVVNTWEVAKECLTTNNRAFATRPKSMSLEILTYIYVMIGLLRKVREFEVLALARDICEEYRRKIICSTGDSRAEPASSLLVDMKRWFGDLTANIMFSMTLGKRFNDSGEGDEEGRKALRDWVGAHREICGVRRAPLPQVARLGRPWEGHEEDCVGVRPGGVTVVG
ncbi:hypothetical protein CRG98_034140 [Punica granatum]|uniref:Cytochrome P450 CYP82D47-like n=1 Tax=Punica granatum TaxID=22663 RepID=A0A2I0INB6_PUNGR|nr:hypothetical protein CRG98_034140 [Punica granatum]